MSGRDLIPCRRQCVRFARTRAMTRAGPAAALPNPHSQGRAARSVIMQNRMTKLNNMFVLLLAVTAASACSRAKDSEPTAQAQAAQAPAAQAPAAQAPAAQSTAA